MKKKLIDAGILAAVFVIAVIFFEVLLSRNDRDLMADLGNATLPRAYFSVEGYAVNPMNGYVEEMDVTTLRGAVTPVANDKLLLNISAEERKVSSIDYEVCSLDGEEQFYKNTIKKVSEQVSLTFDGKLDGEERLLKVTLQTDEGPVYYYTRIVNADGFGVVPCLDYVYNFHESALAKRENAGVGKALEPSDEMDNDSFAHVTIHSDYDHVTWGKLTPQVVGGERWTIQETNENYTSVLLEYEVYCDGDGEEKELHTVKEFFRVRAVYGNLYLLNYDRTMEQLFDGSRQVLENNAITLGITASEENYEVNSEGTIVSFVQANELWNYNCDTNEMALLFSFRDAENTDVRNKVTDHGIRILGMDNKGNTTFAVTGYMNRGSHEGQVGMAVYYYDIDTNSTLEKAFVPSRKAPEIARQQFGKLAYYSAKQNCLYTVVGGTLYEVDVEKNDQKAIAQGLIDGQYCTSDSGKWIAYQTGESVETSTEVVVKNLYNKKEYTVTSKEDECVVPLGFVNNDFVCGYAKQSEVGSMISGEKAIPMYAIEIRNAKNEVIRTQESGDNVVLGANISDGMITLNRGKKTGDTYTAVSPDYIANNDEKKESNITVETFVTDRKETQRRIVFGDGIQETAVKVLKPKQVLKNKAADPEFEEDATDGNFYVYGLGALQGIYKNAGEAVIAADRVSGVVVDDARAYVWERGNWAPAYTLSESDAPAAAIAKQLKEGHTALEAIEETTGKKGIELTGCKVEQLFYQIAKGTAVVAVRDGASPLVLIGYSQTGDTVTYIDASDLSQKTLPVSQMDDMMKGSGNIFIGYLP